MTTLRDADDDRSADSRQGIQSVEFAAEVLRAMAELGAPVGLQELATAMQQAPSKLHRYLVSLGRGGLTTQSAATGRYDLGPGLRRLGVEAFRRVNEVDIATTQARTLSDRTGCSVNLSVWSDRGPVMIRWEHGTRPLALIGRIGATVPVLTSAAGHLFLAHMPETMTAPLVAKELETLPRGAQPDVPAIVGRVLADGYALSRGAPIGGQDSYAVLVPSVSDPVPIAMTLVVRAPDATLDEDEIVRELLAARAAAVAELGLPEGT